MDAPLQGSSWHCDTAELPIQEALIIILSESSNETFIPLQGKDVILENSFDLDVDFSQLSLQESKMLFTFALMENMLSGKGGYFYPPFQEKSPVCSNIGDFFCALTASSRVNMEARKDKAQAGTTWGQPHAVTQACATTLLRYHRRHTPGPLQGSLWHPGATNKEKPRTPQIQGTSFMRQRYTIYTS